MPKYYIERMSMIKVLGDLTFFGTFHLSPIGELVEYNEKFQSQEVVVEFVKKIGDFSCAWDFSFIDIFCILYVDSSLLHIVKPHL